ncbi:alpha/beta hydrolase [Allokutzneria sp. A3M-2-11 16]|uniref:alpha/beta fold hydrolase n=1 Tax=Allokutzneria sp. A3M-2-11 16 TaxID=2962043 RepID=UPI0020B79320|nr:alpha/beta fold hydrolase [Allokutzneria sp. A3M-2-11 16]MCP3803487.1 alpha/beta hydrolase [Allokutzneria sp. A3M-2-11 16]
MRKTTMLAAMSVVLTASGTVYAEVRAAGLSWQPCNGVWQAPRVECTSVEVPIDWEHPGKKIALTIGRLKHTGTGPSRGVVFSIPGGPGGSGIRDLKEHEASFAEIRKDFDVVSFDRRGHGYSDHLPKECHQLGMPVDAPVTKADFDALSATNRAAVRACQDRAPKDLLHHVDSAAVARDIDAVRAALGQQQLRILANSYGGVPATTYARLFPRRVAALVMDGAIGHVITLDEDEQEEVTRFEKLFNVFLAWCEANTSCALHGRDVRADWRGVIDKAEREPLPVLGTDITYTSAELQRVAGAYLGRGTRNQELSVAIDMAMKGNAKAFHDTFGAKPLGSPWLISVECGDEMNRTWRDHADYERSQQRMKVLLPEFWAMPLRGAMCIGTDYPVTTPAPR